MRKKGILSRTITLLIAVIMLLSCVIGVSALIWNGEGAASGSATKDATGGYSIPKDTATKCVVGYRFSGALGSDNTKRPDEDIRSIDVMINDTYRSNVLSIRSKMWPQYTKADYFQIGFDGNTSLTKPATMLSSATISGYSKYTYDEDDLGCPDSLPGYSSSSLDSALGAWQAEDENINVIAKKLGWANGISSMANNDRIYIEPLFAVTINGEGLVLTPSEMAWVGAVWYPNSSTGAWDFNGKNNGCGSGDGSWAFIGDFTHKYFATLLYAPDASGSLGWTLGTTALTSRQTSAYILTSSYGVGICYQKTVTIPDIVVTDIFAVDDDGIYYTSPDKDVCIPNNKNISIYAVVAVNANTAQKVNFYRYQGTSYYPPTDNTGHAKYYPATAVSISGISCTPTWSSTNTVGASGVTLEPGRNYRVKLYSGTYSYAEAYFGFAAWLDGRRYTTTTVGTHEVSKTNNYDYRKVFATEMGASYDDLAITAVKVCTDETGTTEFPKSNGVYQIPYNQLAYIFAKYANNSDEAYYMIMGYDNSRYSPVTDLSESDRYLGPGETTGWLKAGRFLANEGLVQTRTAYVYKQGTFSASDESNSTNNYMTFQWRGVGYTITCNKPACSTCGTANCSGGENTFWQYTGDFYSLSKSNPKKSTAIGVPTAMGTGYESFLGYWTSKNGAGTQIIDASGNILTDVNYFKQDTTIYANCAQTKVTVYYHSNGATSITYAGTAITEAQLNSNYYSVFQYHTANASGLLDGNNASGLNMTRTGYTFTGNWLVGSATSSTKVSQSTAWTACGGGSLASGLGINISSASTEIHLYAEWAPTGYTITYDYGGGQHSDASNIQNYNITTDLTLKSAPTKSGQTFTGWKVTVAGGNWALNASYSAAQHIGTGKWGNITLTAQWSASAVGYTVKHYWQNVNDNNYTLHETTSGSGTIGGTVTPALNSYTGFHAKSTATTITLSATASSNVVEYYYDRNVWTVTTTGDSGISATEGGGQKRYGAAVSVSATVKNGYTWSKWTGYGETTYSPYNFTMPDQDVTVKANTTINSYTITYDSNGGSAVEAQSYNVTTDLYLRAGPTKTGSTFDGWEVSVAGGNWTSGSTFSSNQHVGTGKYGNVTLKAKWKVNGYTVTVMARYMGINGSYGDYSSVYSQGFNYGATFPGWSFGGNDEYNSASVAGHTVTENKTHYVDISRKTYTVTLRNGAYIDAVSGGGTKYYGATAVIDATVNANGSWVNWTVTGGSTVVSTSKNYSFVVKSSVDYTANGTAGGANYTVNHYKENVGKNGWELAATETLGSTIGASVTPAVKSYAGFTSPSTQTVTVAASGTVVNYYYYRNTYTMYFANNINLLTGMGDIGSTTSDRMTYSISNGVVTVKANYQDGYGFTTGRVYLEAGKTYAFAATTSAGWGSECEAFLMLDGSYSVYYYMSGNFCAFTPSTTGTYWLRLDVNTNGSTQTFRNISISEVIDSKTLAYGAQMGAMPAPARNGYSLVGWYNGHALYDNTIPYRNSPWLYYADKYTDLYGAFHYDTTALRNHYYNNGYKEGSDNAGSGRRISEYISTDAYNYTGNIVVFAGWEPNVIKLTLNGNGGSGHTSAVYFRYGINAFYTDAACTQQITAITRPTRTGYTYDTSKGFTGDGTCGGVNGERYVAYESIEFASDLCSDIYKDATLYANWTVNSYYLDLNGWLDGASSGNISGYGTCDVYINGALVADDCTDYWSQHPYGTTYEIKDIKTATGHTYNGVYSGSLTGSIPASNIAVVLNFTTNTYTDTINHWMWGFQNGEGNNGDKRALHITDTTFTAKYGSTFTLGTGNATTIPNGFYLAGTFGTSSITGSWANYAMGTTVTQVAGSMGFEYDYHPYTYNITYNLNGGTLSAANPATYNVLYGVTFNNPTRVGYTFDGWYIGNTKVTGINPGANASFSSISDMYSKLSSRTTGDVTVEARWKVRSPSRMHPPTR